MTTSKDRLLEIQEIIGAKLIVFMEKNVTRFVEDEDEQTALIITTLTSCLSSFMASVSETCGRMEELKQIVLGDIEEGCHFGKMKIRQRDNHDS